MSRTSTFFGILLALAIHAPLFLAPGGAAARPTPEAAARPTGRITVPPPVPEAEREPAPVEPEPAPELDRVVRQHADEIPADIPGDFAISDERVDDALPPLQLIWSDPSELINVGRALRLRVLAIGPDSAVLGEVALQQPVSLIRFRHDTTGYSNRIRVLRSTFGLLPSASGKSIRAYWILIPARLDREISEQMRRALQDEGATAAQVRRIEAKFIHRDGRYVLSIERVNRA